MNIFQIVERNGWRIPVQVQNQKWRRSFATVKHIAGHVNGEELPGPPPCFNCGEVRVDVHRLVDGSIEAADQLLQGAENDEWMPYPNDGTFIESWEIEWPRKMRIMDELERRQAASGSTK